MDSNTMTHHNSTKKNTQIHKVLQFLSTSFFFFNHYKIVHYQLSLFIFNVGKCDHIILLSLYNVFIFMWLSLSICLFFFNKNILNKMTNLNTQPMYLIVQHNNTHSYII